MKAVVIKQPWAELVASGRKTLEVRTWRTRHRG
ncbi:MAG: ASCH domain-containing protein, partial [Planctomycetes bacterium]|nr:ASCH domain-containing protein [Planctomycetota bacterium]